MSARRLAAVALCLALAVLDGCSAAPQQGAQEQAVSGTSSAAVSESAGSPNSSAVEVAEPEEPKPTASEGETTSALSTISLEANGSKLSVALADTNAARALADKLADGPIALELSAYGGLEKVGPLGFSLPTSDEQVTTQPGDVMLYQGNQLTIFTGSNTWAYTHLGRVDSANANELVAILGEGDVNVTLSLGETAVGHQGIVPW